MTSPAPQVDMNLVPGQFQLGNTVMGEWTPFSVEDIDIGNYQLNQQDYQVSGSNEIKFGQDTLKPMPMQMKINVRINRLNTAVAALTKDLRTLNFDDDPNLSDLQREWRAEGTLANWNTVKPLLFCAADGITRQFFGRPGKFSYKKHLISGSLYYQCTCEFRRSDTYGYGQYERFIRLDENDAQIVLGTGGTAPSWTRWLIYGPANFPIINFGNKQFQVNYNILPGDIVEVSSHPWMRRVINLAGQSLSPYLVSNDHLYLDDSTWRIDNAASTEISWHATDTTEDSKVIFLWYDAYQVMD